MSDEVDPGVVVLVEEIDRQSLNVLVQRLFKPGFRVSVHSPEHMNYVRTVVDIISFVDFFRLKKIVLKSSPYKSGV